MNDEPTTPPEAPKPANWDLARTLYAQGLPTQQIALQCNVSLVALRKRITRQGWAAARSQALGITRRAAPVPAAPADDLAAQSREARTLCAQESIRALRQLQKVPIAPNLKSAKAHSAVLAQLTGSASSTFSWTDGAPRTIAVLNLGALRSPRLVSPEELTKPIDVESKPVIGEASPVPAPEPPASPGGS